MNTKFQVQDLLVIDEITQQSQNMINSIGTGNFSKTPVIYEQLYLVVAEILRGALN